MLSQIPRRACCICLCFRYVLKIDFSLTLKIKNWHLKTDLKYKQKGLIAFVSIEYLFTWQQTFPSQCCSPCDATELVGRAFAKNREAPVEVDEPVSQGAGIYSSHRDNSLQIVLVFRKALSASYFRIDSTRNVQLLRLHTGCSFVIRKCWFRNSSSDQDYKSPHHSTKTSCKPWVSSLLCSFGHFPLSVACFLLCDGWASFPSYFNNGINIKTTGPKL